MTGNQKKILDYTCNEAVRQDGDKKITAWFTSAIPLSSGPAQYGGLPGMIMEVNVNDDELSMTAVDLSFTSVDKKLLVKPTEGKKVTEAEFRQIVDEKTKEMQEQNGGNGNVIIRMHNDGPR
jgi:GLPGLI family protein